MVVVPINCHHGETDILTEGGPSPGVGLGRGLMMPLRREEEG